MPSRRWGFFRCAGVFFPPKTIVPFAELAGAPKAGDKSAWGPRIAEGKATLYQHALNGYSGKTGVMPAKGGRTDLPDDLIKQGVDYMVSLAQ